MAAETERVESFVHEANPGRVVFGAGTLSRLRDEVERLGGSRVLVIGRSGAAAAVLGPLVAGRFDGVAMHTPVEVTDRAERVLRECRADCLVSIGGGSSTGLGKALTARTGLPQIAVPTTYAGSEVTPVLGETADGRKTTRRSPDLLPKAVVYDVELTTGLPVGMSVVSGLNAMAHAVEALYSPQADPAIDAYALDAIGRLARALPRIVTRPDDLDARSDALIGAWLAGICLGTVAMGPHHKLAHVLGGSFGLPHAETHAVLLPHVMAFQAPAAMDRIARALGVPDAPAGMYDLSRRLGAPASLASLGMAADDLPAAASQVPVDGILPVLTAAWRGDRPSAPLGTLTEQVAASFPNDRLGRLLGDLVRRVHGHVVDNDVTEAEWQYAIDFLTRTGQMCGPTRQEFILLSDTLGVSSTVDLLTNSRTTGSTPSAVLGPFYVEGPPAVPLGSDLAAGLPGVPLYADIRVTDSDGQPVPDAVVDVWQSNRDGFYDVQLPDLDGPVLRARLRTDSDGRLWFWSILPSEYPIPDDGPVGEMLRATGRHPYRAPHLHFMIMAPGFRRLVTQLFVAGGPYLDSDAVFGVKPELIVDFTAQDGPAPDGRVVDGEWRNVAFTFHIARDGQK